MTLMLDDLCPEVVITLTLLTQSYTNLLSYHQVGVVNLQWRIRNANSMLMCPLFQVAVFGRSEWMKILSV